MDTTTGSVPGPAGGLTRGQENRALVALALPVLLISMDATILGFAVPRLSEDLEPTSAELLWIIDIYSFVLSGLLITMGNVGDRIGRRRLLLYGAAGFSVASLAAAFAPTPLALIGARALLGRGRGDADAVDPLADPQHLHGRPAPTVRGRRLGHHVLGRRRRRPDRRRPPARALLVGLGLPGGRAR